MTAPDNSHVPTIAKQHDNCYGVHCLACSDLAQDYVWPCREGWTTGVPAVLVVAEDLAAAREDLAKAERQRDALARRCAVRFGETEAAREELSDTQQASQDAVRGLAETVEDMRRERDAAREDLADANGLVEQFRRDLGVWEKRYAEMLDQRDKALHEVTEARQVIACRDAALDASTETHRIAQQIVLATLGHAAVPGDGEQATTVRAALGDNWSQLLNDDGEQAATTCGCGRPTLDGACTFHGRALIALPTSGQA